MKARRFALAALAVLLAAPFPGPAQEAAYPAKPIKVVVPGPPGAPVDLAARVVGEKLATALGQPLVYENRPGAAYLVGMEAVARAPADGYTLGVNGLAYVMAATLAPKLPYDAERAFAPIALVDWAYQILVVPAASPAKSVAELVAAAKASPGALKYASGGNGTPSHLVAALFSRAAGVEITHVPYKGAPFGATAVLAGECDMMFGPIGPLAANVRAGKLRALATPAPRRAAMYAELPTLEELGYLGIHMRDWHGFVAPAGTPQRVITRLQDEIAKATAMPDVKERLEGAGMEAAAVGSTEFAGYIRGEFQKWGRVIRDAGIKAD